MVRCVSDSQGVHPDDAYSRTSLMYVKYSALWVSRLLSQSFEERQLMMFTRFLHLAVTLDTCFVKRRLLSMVIPRKFVVFSELKFLSMQ